MNTAMATYATDEDVALRAPADFAMLCPRHQRLAAGDDGAFEPSDVWALKSASVDFVASGLAPGHVIQLIGPSSAFSAPGELLAVARVAPDALGLRRLGQPPGLGAPPAPATGLSGVEFLAVTLGPQLEAVSREFDLRYGLDPHRAATAAGPIDPLAYLRTAAVLSVLHRRYLDLGQGTGGAEDPLIAKGRRIAAELDDLLVRAPVHLFKSEGSSMSCPLVRLSR